MAGAMAAKNIGLKKIQAMRAAAHHDSHSANSSLKSQLSAVSRDPTDVQAQRHAVSGGKLP
jgi:hypothetical protein